jgi:hypothetical protein
VRPFEAFVIAYLVFFMVAAPFTRAAARRRWAIAFVAGATAVAVYAVSRLCPLTGRLWLPFLYIAIGYWIPAPLVPPFSGGAFESWLRRNDAAVRKKIDGIPGWLATGFQLGYLACFPLVPTGFAVVWFGGSPDAVAEYWRGVLVAGFACYFSLPWLVSRPLRLIEDPPAGSAPAGVARVNRHVLGLVSHGLNTFPSGHVAVSIAVAIGAGRVSPTAGVILGVIAAAVAVGAFTGRYHYAADVAFGTVVGAAASL